jgi:hypothetical protein
MLLRLLNILLEITYWFMCLRRVRTQAGRQAGEYESPLAAKFKSPHMTTISP